MEKHQQDAVERGMTLAADLPDLTFDQIDERLKPVYEDIQQSLRVPIVNQIFRTLANYPDFLEQAWRASKSIVRSVDFEQAADDLRQQALLTDAPSNTSLGASSITDAAKLVAFNDTIHYVLPKLLLVTSAFREGAFGGRQATSEHSPKEMPERLSGVADGATGVALINPADADDSLTKLFDDIKQRHGHSIVSSYYRGLGQWPDFLASAWQQVAAEVNSEEYLERRSQLVEAALTYVRSWPLPVINVSADHRTEIQDILTAFRLKFIPEMLLDVVLIKALLDGKKAAGTSRFSRNHQEASA